MAATLIAVSLLMLTALGLAALFMAGADTESSSADDMSEDKEVRPEA